MQAKIMCLHYRSRFCTCQIRVRNALKTLLFSMRITNSHSCMGICYGKLFGATKIMRFTCCLNITFSWKSLNWALICMHDVTLECFAAMTGHIADDFVRENVARVYLTLWRRKDVRNLTLTTFCFEKSSVRKWIFNV